MHTYTNTKSHTHFISILLLLFISFLQIDANNRLRSTSCKSLSTVITASGEFLPATDIAHISFDQLTVTTSIGSKISTKIETLHLSLSNHDNALLFPSLNGVPLSSSIAVSNDGLVSLSLKNTISWKSKCGTTNTLLFTIIHSDCTVTFTVIMNNEICESTGEPHFFGLRGQTFVIHPLDGNVYNLISSSNLQLNVEFLYLGAAHSCPIIPSTGRRATACWAAPACYMSRLGLMTAVGEHLLLESGKGETGFASITLNSRSLEVGDFVDLTDGGYIIVNNTHEVTFYSDAFHITIENNDEFLTISSVAVTPEDWPKLTLSSGTHGLLGQTWRNKRYNGRVTEIEGDTDDYIINENDLFGVDFVFNRFTKHDSI